VSLTALPDYAVAQSLKDRLVGSWLLISNTNTAPDGTKRQPFGENPKGVLFLEANGRKRKAPQELRVLKVDKGRMPWEDRPGPNQHHINLA
jgi:hypothetical protein